jgi:hypothetical protein
MQTGIPSQYARIIKVDNPRTEALKLLSKGYWLGPEDFNLVFDKLHNMLCEI